jgi:hypothetical protein
MITLMIVLLNKFCLGGDDEIYMYCLYTCFVDGLLAWGFLLTLLEKLT